MLEGNKINCLLFEADEDISVWLTVEADVMIGEDDRSVALGNASHRHMENAMWCLDVVFLQAGRRKVI